MSQSGEFIKKVEHRGRGPRRRACHVLQALGYHQAQPAGIGAQAIRRQDEEHRGGARLQIPERKIRMPEGRRHARAIEEMGMALRGRENAGRFAMVLA